MLVPNRNFQSPAYRYGFQGQEKDDEVKGNGNSLNYKFRMHDPRIGRFFAVDPLTKKYPWYTPYQFSGNKVIDHIELEGLEERDITFGLDPSLHPFIANDSREQYKEDKKWHGIGFSLGIGIGGVAIFDFFVTRGKITKQVYSQIAINSIVNLTLWKFSDNEEFDPQKAVEDAFTGFDIADFGTDQLVNLALSKYKLGVIKKILVKSSVASIFDITYKDGVQVVGFNKDANSFIKDVVGNVLTESVDIKLGEKKDYFSSVRVESSDASQLLSNIIMEAIERNVTKQQKKLENKTDDDGSNPGEKIEKP